MTQATFEVFDWIDRGITPLQQLYEERLQLLEVADRAGFFASHLAEHHEKETMSPKWSYFKHFHDPHAVSWRAWPS